MIFKELKLIKGALICVLSFFNLIPSYDTVQGMKELAKVLGMTILMVLIAFAIMYFNNLTTGSPY